MINKALISTAFSALFFVVIIFGLQSTVFAYRWPGNKWDSSHSFSIKLDVSDIHTDTTADFGIYFDGNTTNIGGSFNVVIDHTECTTDYKITRANNNSDNKSCAIKDKDFNVSYKNGGGVYDDTIKMTMYAIRVEIPYSKGNTLKFKVDVNDADRIGFLATGGTLPLTFDGGDKRNWSTIKIPIREKCDRVSALGSFWFYDIDNRNSLLGAQDNGGLKNNPDGFKTADFPNLDFQYIPLKIGLEKVSDGSQKVAAGQLGFAKKTEKNLYIAENTDSGQYGILSYNFTNKGKAFNIVLNDWNNDNYLSLKSPHNEFVKYCENPPKENWLLTSKSTPSSNILYKGQTGTYTHLVWNTGPDNLSDFIDVDTIGSDTGTEYYAYDFSDMNVGEASGQTITRSATLNTTGKRCDNVWYDPYAKVDDVLDYNRSTSQACIYVIDPDTVVPTESQFEKGSSSFAVSSKIIVDNGGACPDTQISIPYTVTIKGVKTDHTYNYGGAAGCNSLPDPIVLPSNVIADLNNLPPGPSDIQFCLKVIDKPEKCGKILVFEVPFARFYGNDIYATNKDTTKNSIRFNDSFNDDSVYDGRGAAAQYAALTFGNVKIDTSAFRTFEWTKPPNDTDAPGSALSALYPAGKNRIFDDVKAALPDVCPQMDSGGLNAPQNGCYTIQEGSPTATPTWRRGISVLGWGDTFGAGDTTYNKRVTVYNPSDKMLMIAGNIINGTSFASNPEPEDVGVLLVVSEGPIVIDNNVQRVDAILVSKTGIYTCGFGGFGPDKQVSQATIHKTCRNTLTINGAVAAPIIDFRRAVGSRYLNPVPDTANGYANCNDFAGIKNCNARGNGINDDWTESPLWSGNFPASNPSGGAAEIVNYPAYLYFAKPYLKDKGVSGGEAAAMFVAPPRQ
jgi:hypothetical protein